MPTQDNHVLLICTTCKGQQTAAQISQELADRLPDGFGIRMIACMAGCDTPTAVGFQADGKAQYLFGRIESAHDLDALADFAQQYRQSDTGWTRATDRPVALMDKTLSRMPPLGREVTL